MLFRSALYNSYHANWFTGGEFAPRQAPLERLSAALRAKGVDSIGYKTDKTDEGSGIEFLHAQMTMAPVLLKREASAEQLVLFNWQATRTVAPVEGYSLVEDLGGGLALFRKN
mgnify:CR=1 FL=1